MAFGPTGLFLGVLAAALHGALRARESSTSRWALGLWHLLFLPATLAVLLAALPTLAWIIAGPLLFILWAGTPTPQRLRGRRKPLVARAAGVVSLLATLWLCAELPVKQLDGVVGPAAYRSVSLQELSDRLYEDHGVSFGVHEDGPRQRVVDFTIPYAMTRREVLHKLANNTGLCLLIGYCGTGSTLLWGNHAAFTSLSPRQ